MPGVTSVMVMVVGLVLGVRFVALDLLRRLSREPEVALTGTVRTNRQDRQLFLEVRPLAFGAGRCVSWQHQQFEVMAAPLALVFEDRHLPLPLGDRTLTR